MKGAAIIVHYHTPDLVEPAVEALRRDAETAGLELACFLVDNGSGSGDAVRWQSLPLRVLDPGRNLGYAGGANHGIGQVDADWWIVMNPDVFVRPGCLQALHDELQHGAGVAGPRFFWDHDATWHLPPTEKRRRWDELLSVLARLGGGWAKLARRRWRRHAWHHWTAEQSVESFELSGALLAIRRQAWERIGPFDEGYQLYFEETDWLERLRRAGGKARFVPAAEAVHLHARSTIAEPRSEGWFLEAARRFRSRHYGRGFNRWLERLGQWSGQRVAEPAAEIRAAMDWSAEERAHASWLEVSAVPAGFPAAGRRLHLPQDDLATILQQLQVHGAISGNQLSYLRTVDEAGRELQCRVMAAVQ